MPKYYNQAHQKAYLDYLAKDATHLHDNERQALFYLLALLPTIRENIHLLYDFENHNIRLDALICEFQTSSTLAITKLAFTLYNSFYETVNTDVDSYDLLIKETSNDEDYIYTSKHDDNLYFRKPMYIIETKPFSIMDMFSPLNRELFPYLYEAINIRFDLINAL